MQMKNDRGEMSWGLLRNQVQSKGVGSGRRKGRVLMHFNKEWPFKVVLSWEEGAGP